MLVAHRVQLYPMGTAAAVTIITSGTVDFS